MADDLAAEIAALSEQVAKLTADKAALQAKVDDESNERYEAERRRDQLKTVVQQLNWRTENEAELLPSADQYRKRGAKATASPPPAIRTRAPKGDIDMNSDADAVQSAIGDLLKLSPMSQKKEKAARARKERAPSKRAQKDTETFGAATAEPAGNTPTRAEQNAARKEKRAEKAREDAETAKLIIEMKKKKEEESLQQEESTGGNDGEPSHAQRTEVANSLRQAAQGRNADGLRAAIVQAEKFGMVSACV
jgi:hypothetical protein